VPSRYYAHLSEQREEALLLSPERNALADSQLRQLMDEFPPEKAAEEISDAAETDGVTSISLSDGHWSLGYSKKMPRSLYLNIGFCIVSASGSTLPNGHE
jgi:hypothetical protein